MLKLEQVPKPEPVPHEYRDAFESNCLGNKPDLYYYDITDITTINSNRIEPEKIVFQHLYPDQWDEKENLYVEDVEFPSEIVAKFNIPSQNHVFFHMGGYIPLEDDTDDDDYAAGVDITDCIDAIIVEKQTMKATYIQNLWCLPVGAMYNAIFDDNFQRLFILNNDGNDEYKKHAFYASDFHQDLIWKQLASSPYNNELISMGIINNGNDIIVSGNKSSHFDVPKDYNNVYLYNVNNNKWSDIGKDSLAANGRTNIGIMCDKLNTEKVYFIGGNEKVEEDHYCNYYNLTKQQWIDQPFTNFTFDAYLNKCWMDDCNQIIYVTTNAQTTVSPQYLEMLDLRDNVNKWILSETTIKLDIDENNEKCWFEFLL